MANILVVDDSQTMTHLMKGILERDGHTVTTAKDGLSAFSKLRNPFDLILLDIEMPGVSGIELCTTIRQASYHVDTPIIIVSGSTKYMDERMARKFGANAYVNKPFEQDTFVDTVGHWLAESLAAKR